MSCINDVRLVGCLTKDPEFVTLSSGKRFARLVLETFRYIRVNGQSKRISQIHTVVCFNQFALDPLRELARKGSWIKVLGELDYRDGRAEIVVSQYTGDCGLMSIPGQDDEPSNAQQSAPAETGGPAPRASSGGLGRLPRGGGGRDDETPRERAAGRGRSSSDEALDDEIPF